MAAGTLSFFRVNTCDGGLFRFHLLTVSHTHQLPLEDERLRLFLSAASWRIPICEKGNGDNDGPLMCPSGSDHSEHGDLDSRPRATKRGGPHGRTPRRSEERRGSRREGHPPFQRPVNPTLRRGDDCEAESRHRLHSSLLHHPCTFSRLPPDPRWVCRQRLDLITSALIKSIIFHSAAGLCCG